MVNGDGNGHNPLYGPTTVPADMQDITINDVKALYPQMQSSPLFSPDLGGNNPGLRIVQNDGDLHNMLKLLYIENVEMALTYARAIFECSLFLFDDEEDDPAPATEQEQKAKAQRQPHPEVLRRIEGIKTIMALKCSVHGRWTDAYKQVVTGVITSTFVDGKGTVNIMPVGKQKPYEQYEGGPAGNGNGRDKRGNRP